MCLANAVKMPLGQEQSPWFLMPSQESHNLQHLKIYCTIIYDFILNAVFQKLHNTQPFVEW